MFPSLGITPPFITFRDAGFCINTFPITVLDCARAMRKAVSLGHFHYKSFNPTAFHQLAKLQNGDFSWIIPGKFLAFSGPITKYVCALPSSTSFIVVILSMIIIITVLLLYFYHDDCYTIIVNIFMS